MKDVVAPFNNVPRLALIALILPPAPVCVLMRWLF